VVSSSDETRISWFAAQVSTALPRRTYLSVARRYLAVVLSEGKRIGTDLRNRS
jgi:hypothetical protein